MYSHKYLKVFTVCVGIATISACTKLNQNLNSTLTSSEASNSFSAESFLQTAYVDIGNPMSDLGNIFALEEVTSDECLVPTRGGDWDDNGKWRALHQHNWTTDNVDIFLNMFNACNKINFDATNVLNFKPTPYQIAQARFIRAFAVYQLFNLFGQFSVRNPTDNLLNAPPVLKGEDGYQYIVKELTDIIPDLKDKADVPDIHIATKDAATVLLMRLYLNHGALVNRAAPTFDDADMQNVIQLGQGIISSNNYSYVNSYFDNFNATNQNTKEGIFACPNISGVGLNNTNISNRWFATLHYNQYTPLNPAAGWNGFSTTANTYNMFAVNGATAAETPVDTLLDKRIGGRYYKGATDISGLRPGFLIGQQYNELGQKEKDRKNPPNDLAFQPQIAPDLKENGNNLEITGIRVAKYPPDYSLGTKSYSTAGNWMMVFRYPEVVLMVAEAKMRSTSAPDPAGAMMMVNDLRSARGAAPLTSLTLVDASNSYAPNTLLAERGRELYWENMRRTDLIRFGVFLNAGPYKQASTATYLLFPIPSASLAANPNLTQNTGY